MKTQSMNPLFPRQKPAPFLQKESGPGVLPAYLSKMMLCCLLLFTTAAATAQQTVSGRVSDKSTGAALNGASITVAGKKSGTTAGKDGAFTISAAAGDRLEIGSIGHKTEIVTVAAGMDFLEIQLDLTAKELEDVVVVGYGTRSKKDLTGAVSSVKLENSPLAILPNANALDAIKGSLPGLDIGAVSNAGGNPSFEIRGQNSILASNNPLVVLDGVIFVGSFNEINPNDIASVDVLKDASAAAVYGSRGANGVIMITTKKGRSGKPVINLRSTTGVQTYTGRPDMRKGQDFIQYRYDVKKQNGASPADLEIDRLLNPKELEAYKANHTVDWFSQTVKPALFQDYQVNFSGGTDRMNFYVSGDYLKQDGIVFNDNFKKFTFLAKLEARVTDWMKYGLSLNVANKNADGVAADLEKGTILGPYSYVYSTFPGYESWYERYPQTSTTTFSPFFKTLTYDEDRNTNYRSLNYIRMDVPFIKGLSYTVNYALNRWENHSAQFNNEKTFVNTLALADLQHQTKYLASANGFRSNQERTDWYLNHLVNYTHTFAAVHAVDITLLSERQSQHDRIASLTATDFSQAGTTALGVNSLELGDPTKRVVNTGDTKLSQLAYLARANYVYKNRYLLSGSIRRDGYSAFAEGNKYGNFKSVAAAWTISQESFFRNMKWADFLKLRISYGETGNPSIGAYSTLATVGTSSYLFGTTPVNTSFAGRLPNAALRWENSRSTNIGLDFALFHDFISGSIDYYNADTRDLLIGRAIPITNGFGSVNDNIGKIRNKGIEIKLVTKNVNSKNFRWSSGINFWMNRNRIVSLYGLDGNKDGKEDDDIANSYFIGKSLGAIFDYTFDGIVQTGDAEYIAANPGTKPGDIKFRDISGNGKIGTEDRSITGYSKPNYTFTFSNTLNYKKLELYFLFNVIAGGGKDNFYMGNNQYAQNPGALFPTIANWLNKPYWTPENPSNTIPRPIYGNTLGYKFSKRRDFARLQDLSLSYTFSSRLLQKTPLKDIRAYVAGKNLFTFTDWEGLDPETGTNYAAVSGFPVFRTFTLGVSVTF